ncbi:MAG: phospholipid carrier-dependent glycosyltransferase [Candidatus Curtissbacteria bacterium]|nr:phospholipid carrier-dependent glycosyltransferase [Candidatus Curtissbacteria bacterium]
MSRKLFIFLIVITSFSLLIRLYRLSEPNHYYFDEVYHVVTARAYAANNPAAYDPFSPPPEEKTAFDWLHPPLAKLIQAGSIKIIGDNPTGWRLPSAIFGTAIIPATFILAYLVFGRTAAIFVAFVIAFENLTLVMSRIAMNDIFLTFFTISAFIFTSLYVKRRKFKYLLATSVFLGLAVASKWSGIYAIVTIFIYIFFMDLKTGIFKKNNLLLLILPLLIYVSSYGQFWLQGHNVQDFINLHKQIWWYQNRHDLKHPYGTTAIYCAPSGLEGAKTFCPWILDARPIYFSYEQYGQKAGYIYALGNPLIYWFGIAAIIYLLRSLMVKPQKELILVLLGYFIFWVPWIFAPRILFMYHYLPSIPFLSIAIGLLLSKLWKRNRLAVIVIIAIFAVTFFYFYPITSGLPIKTSSIGQYMWFKTWK